eukprot:TRINITY_DN61721_c0_g1_i1.p1 TRINITY_DN61721_c0_g1~~TRINITY_DN61721_c0_g1_i1.p1  ORF type:complete len:778 (+),score=98.37 TRINITY_DN61721_c0_g1_i1:81-2414(+)
MSGEGSPLILPGVGTRRRDLQSSDTKRRSWIENALLKSACQESETLAKKDALPVLSWDRRVNFRRSISGAPCESPPEDGSVGEDNLREGSCQSDTQRVDDFLNECRLDAAKNVYVEDGGSFAGMGQVYTIDEIPPEALGKPNESAVDKLGELPSTAICGNDITASCFYVIGELLAVSGIYAPLCTLITSATLYCFRSIYGEVVTALPLNGGIYNLLLNSSTKMTASVTACLTILSYTATGVVSAVTAASYVECTPALSSFEKVPLAAGILGFFAILMISGMKESSTLASSVFVLHISVLLILVVFSIFQMQEMGLGHLQNNLSWEKQPPIGESIFFGFSSAMLGVSGFETSANFVEEQKPGVFAATLRNMWASVSIINFVLPCLMIIIAPLDEFTGERSGCSVSVLAEQVGGSTLRDIVGLDAVLVLAGSVLTSYVGVCGLFQRMAGDRCLPEVFAVCNSWRGTPHYTIIFFFGVTTSMCFLLDGDITMLGSIYSTSFLLVMALFSLCGLWMKVQRPTLPRQIHTNVSTFLLGLLFVSVAFLAVVLRHPDVLSYFFVYLLSTVFLVMVTFTRVSIFTAILKGLGNSCVLRVALQMFVRMEVAENWVVVQLQKLRSQGVVYFTKGANISELNRALRYIEVNEEARWVHIVHVYTDEELIPPKLLEYVQLLDCVYPKTRIDCVLVRGEFNPSVVQWISSHVQVPVNSMFINCPEHDFEHRLDTMGGVRVIQNSEKGSPLDDIRSLSGLVDCDSPTRVSRLELRRNNEQAQGLLLDSFRE